MVNISEIIQHVDASRFKEWDRIRYDGKCATLLENMIDKIDVEDDKVGKIPFGSWLEMVGIRPRSWNGDDYSENHCLKIEKKKKETLDGGVESSSFYYELTTTKNSANVIKLSESTVSQINSHICVGDLFCGTGFLLERIFCSDLVPTDELKKRLAKVWVTPVSTLLTRKNKEEKYFDDFDWEQITVDSQETDWEKRQETKELRNGIAKFEKKIGGFVEKYKLFWENM